MSQAKGDLTPAQVKDLLISRPEELLPELAKTGDLLLAECVERGKQLDGKALALIGYGGIVIALVVSAILPKLPGLHLSVWWLIVGGGLSVSVATLYALAAVWIQEYEWFSDVDWFAPSVQKTTTLTQAHILATHQYKYRHESVNARKAARLKRAYGFIVSGAMLLILAALIVAITHH